MKRKLLATSSVTAGLFSMAVAISSAQDPGAAPSDTAPRETTRPDRASETRPSDTSAGATTIPESQGAQVAAKDAAAIKAQLDPQMRKVIDEAKFETAKPFESVTVEEARNQQSLGDAVKRVMKNEDVDPVKIGKVDDIDIKLSDTTLDGRIYKPDGDGPFPVILYFHGGGWVVGDLDDYDASARALSKAANALVISSDYRQAPESKFPTAHNDAFGAYQWVMQNAGRWSGDAKRLAVVGESAGGNLAASVSIMAQDKGIQMPVHQVLIYPVADTKMDTPSYREYANAQPLNAAKMKWFFDQAFSKQEDRSDPKVALLQAKSLQGLPSTTIITAQIDPLRSEGEALAKKLQEQGVQVQYRNYDGVTHEFFGTAPVVDKAQEAVNFVASNLKEAFAARRQEASTRTQEERAGGTGARTGDTTGSGTGTSGDRTGSSGAGSGTGPSDGTGSGTGR